MANLSFIHNLPSELTDFYLIPPNNRYPCNWGYNRVKEEKEVYHIIQAIGGAEYLFIVTDNDYNYWGHSDKFADANKLGQEYGQPKQVEQENTQTIKCREQQLINRFQFTSPLGDTMTTQTVSDTIKGDIPSLFSNWVIIASTTYDAKYGDKYTILAIKSQDSQNFLDIICDTNNNYITLGSERYSQTLEITERMSLLAETERLEF